MDNQEGRAARELFVKQLRLVANTKDLENDPYWTHKNYAELLTLAADLIEGLERAVEKHNQAVSA